MTEKHETEQEQLRSTSLTWKGDPLAKTLQTNGNSSVAKNEAGSIEPAALEMSPETGVGSLSSAVEHHVDIVGVTGSIPVATTIHSPPNFWLPASQAPEGVIVETKIDDHLGVRNEQKLYRDGGMWFMPIPNGGTYVYYVPTHYRMPARRER